MVNMVTKRIRCDAFPCKNLAEFAIGREGRRQASYNYCREDFETIVKEGAELLGYRLVKIGDVPQSPEPETKEPVIEQLDENTITENQPEPVAELNDDEKAVEVETVDEAEKEIKSEHETATDPQEPVETTVNVSDAPEASADPAESKQELDAVSQEEPTAEVYTCKHCGVATFPKTPEGKVQLMQHGKSCPAKEKK